LYQENRSQIVSKGTNQIILDAYNANPSSMAVAIENFFTTRKNNKIIVLGDMFELGEESNQDKSLVEMLLNENEVKCYFIGSAFYNNKLEKVILSFTKHSKSFQLI
jgi:UDP-N-acetylmuramoyl-tripeptide--D-alanyl-D-alanine ligase